MCANITTDNVIDESNKILKIWAANPDFKIKDVTLEQYQAQQGIIAKLQAEIRTKEDELTPLRNKRDDLMKELNANTTRARSGIKGFFGADSSEYELSGGTRASERKKTGPRTTKTATTAK